jgi:hypothetical protein
MSFGNLAACSLARINRNLPACSGRIPALLPLNKNFSSPLCLKLLITTQLQPVRLQV